MDILDILLDILLKPPQPLMGLFFFSCLEEEYLRHFQLYLYLVSLGLVHSALHLHLQAQLEVGGAAQFDVVL